MEQLLGANLQRSGGRVIGRRMALPGDAQAAQAGGPPV